MKRKDFSKLKIEVQKEKDYYFEHEDFIAGVAPFLRGIHTTMYFQKPLKNIVSTDFPLQINKTPEIELANFLTESFNYIQTSVQKNIPVDNAISTITFQTKIVNNQVDEIAKMRAARMLWAKMLKQFNPKNQNSLALNIHAIIKNPSAISFAIFGGCQIINSEETTQLLFEEETGILKTVDPWAGSFIIEKRTEEITSKAWKLFKSTAKSL